MKTLATFAGLLAMALVLGSCENGPSGPDPATELYVEYPGALNGQTLTQSRSAAVQLSDIQIPVRNTDGDRFIQTRQFDFFFTQGSNVTGNEVRFHLGEQPSFSPVMTLFFDDVIPSSPGTYAWKETNTSMGFPGGITVESGPQIGYDGGLTFYPVEGETVILNVQKNGDQVTFIEGYFNGTMKTAPQIVNPGETPVTLTMKVQSALFKHPRR